MTSPRRFPGQAGDARCVRASVFLLVCAGLAAPACGITKDTRPSARDGGSASGVPRVQLDGRDVDVVIDVVPAAFSAVVPLLRRQVRLTVTAAAAPGDTTAPPAALELTRGNVLLGSGRGALEAELSLDVGANSFALRIEGPGTSSSVHDIRIERGMALWEHVEELRAAEPRENGYFGDYLRASSNDLYVNSSRRGQLYRWSDDRWVFSRNSEELLPLAPDWMYEAALADDVLAFVAQPKGGADTLYIFERKPSPANQDWTLALAEEVSTQGTLRAAGQDVVFVSSMGVSFFERGPAGVWSLRARLAPPSPNVGFGERPTYFDAPGVVLQGDWLLVGAPRADVRIDLGGQSMLATCDAANSTPADGRCVPEAGAVFAYRRAVGGAWAQAQVLFAPSPMGGLGFGHAASLDGPFAAIGVPNEGGATGGFSTSPSVSDCDRALNCAEQSGAVFLFRLEGDTWLPGGALKASSSRAHDYFGDSVIWHGDLLLVAAPGLDHGTASDTGGLYAFVRTASGYRELGPFDLGPEHAPSHPFPANMQIARDGLLVASNTSPFIDAKGAEVPFAGLVFFLR